MKEKRSLVSIIVRTKDRPKLLKRALQSIASQTYRPIEVVLVNDGGCAHDAEDLKLLLGDISLNYVHLEKNMGRANAGNAGIGNAKGKFIGFLDDDDEFYPDHVETLVTFLEQSDLKIAYTDSLMAYEVYDPDTKEIKKVKKELVYSQDFDYDILIFENYIPFMCLLFDREVLAASGGLDTKFELYEDYDLLIRLGEKYPFHHLKKTTADYNQWSSASQISQRNNDVSYQRDSYLRLFAKHIDKFTPIRIFNYRAIKYAALINKDNKIENTNAALNAALKDSEGILRDRDVHIGNLEGILRDRDVHIGNLEGILRDRDVHIGNLEGILRDRDVHIGNLEGILRDRDVHIGNLDAILRDKDVQIANLAATVQDKDFVLNNIYRSRGWRVLSLYYRIRDKVLPPNSLRRRSVKFLADFARNPMSVIRSTHGRGAKSIKGEGEGGEKRFICGIETDLSQPVIVGKGNVLHLSGWCYHTTLNIKRVYILVDGIPQRIHNIGMARVDVLADQCREVDRNGNSLNSGFWSLIPFSEIEFPRKVSLTIRALFDNGEQCDQDLGMITLSPSGEIASDHLFERLDVSSQDPLIAICMTTYNPDLKMFTRQVDSIIQQTFKNWVCIISDDGSRRDIFEGIRGIASRDARFYISRNSANLGFYNNFEKCLSMVPQKAMYVAFSDQDDYWHADKLAELVSRFDQTTMLAYSDMNIVNDKGELLHNTYWTTRKNNYTHLDSLLFANTVTGAASMIRRDLMPYLLPFPKKIGDSYHDHWMASIALTKGTMAYVDRPLYDYYQHADNIIGHYTRSNGITVRKIKEAFQRVRSGLKSGEMSQHIKSFLWHSRDVYLNDVVRIILISNILLLRCGDAAIRKRSVIKQFAGFEQSAFGIFVQGVKGKLLRRSTLGAEFYCFRSVIMQKLMNSYFRLRKDRFLSRYTGLVPSKVSSSAVKVESVGSVDVIRQKIAPLTLKVSAEAKKRVNLLIPTIDFKYFFGGYIGKFNFALRLADAGFSVRIIMTDYCNYDLPAWRREIRNYEGLEDFFDRIDVVYAFDRAVPVEVNEKDVFIASTWWTAHIAHKAVTDLKAERFLYLIQEYEPFTFPMGTFYALAQQTYGFPHFAIFSTELLRDYFRRNKLGVFCDLELGERNSVSFENAIQTFSINEQDMRERKPKRFLYYARPEQHAARNMFDLGVLALNKVIEEGYFDSSGWEFYGIGSVSNIESIRLSKDVSMKLLQRVTLKEYADLLPGFDLGLSLMFTPHPSLPPLEMAAAGMMVVTNTFENKTGERLKEISSNIIAVDPTLEGVRLGLIAALEKVHDYRGRLEGSHVNWSSSWPESFNDEIMAKIKNFI